MDDIRSKMTRAVQTRKAEAEEASKRYDESSKKRLFGILQKKIQTSFIGALSQFEQFFGELWGNRKDDSELTPEEREWRELWLQVRTNILNGGNNQIRAVQSELNQYDITWNGYRMKLPVKPAGPSKEEDK